jgi:hypothetical protein
MATITPTITNSTKFRDYTIVYTWTPMTNSGSDVGAALELPGWADRSVQVTGTFGTGGTCLIEGSNDGTNYATLNNLQGSALSIGSASIKGVAEITRYIRPRISAGDGTTSLTVTIVARKAAL